MQNHRCYYEVLELNRDCTQQEIKKAYRRLSLKWHPDKNPDNKDEAQKMFLGISAAYKELSDPDRRRSYDRFGFKAHRNEGITFKDADDMFNHLFSQGPSNHSQFQNEGEDNQNPQGALQQFNLELGGVKMFSVLRNGREMAGLKKSTKISKTTNAYGQQIVKKVTTVVHEDGSRTITQEIVENGHISNTNIRTVEGNKTYSIVNE